MVQQEMLEVVAVGTLPRGALEGIQLPVQVLQAQVPRAPAPAAAPLVSEQQLAAEPVRPVERTAPYS